MKRIVILGPQGSGKGTQANLLAERLGIPALSMGQMLRDEFATGSELGKRVQEAIEVGTLAKDEDALEVFQNRLKKDDAANGFLIDGYPRNMAQYEVSKDVLKPTDVLMVTIPREESMNRLMKRAELEGRIDDTPDIINNRLDIYEAETMPVLELYRQEGVLKEVDGLGTVEEVTARINEALGV